MKHLLILFLILAALVLPTNRVVAATSTFYCCKANSSNNNVLEESSHQDLDPSSSTYRSFYTACKSDNQSEIYTSSCAGTIANAPIDTPAAIFYIGCSNGTFSSTIYDTQGTCAAAAQKCLPLTLSRDQVDLLRAHASNQTFAEEVGAVLGQNAQTACATVTQAPAAATSAGTPAATTTTPSGRVTLPNPLGTTSPEELIGRVIKAVLSIVGSLALLMFIYGGFMWMTAQGSSEGVKKGQEIIKWSVAGLLLIFSAYIILRYVLGALQGTFTP